MANTTERTTSSGETITTRETSRRSYFVTLTPNMYGRGDIGPAIVDIVTYAHTSNTRPVITPTFVVFIDGEHQWAGPEEHIIGNIDYALRGSFINPVEISPVRETKEYAVWTVQHSTARAKWFATEDEAREIAAKLSTRK